MKISAAIALLLTATALHAQDSSAPYTLKAVSNRVLIDVVVKDKKGNLVHGLKQSDFTVLENNQPQTLKNFDEHVSTSAAASQTPAFPALPPGQFTNFVPVKPNDAVIILLFDKLNTGLRDQAYVRTQLVNYLKSAKPDSRIAIYGLTDHLLLLKSFTQDPKLLLAALDDKALLKASPLRDDVNGGGNGVEDLSAVTNLLGRVDTSLVGAVTSFQAQYQGFQAQIQGKLTLDALNALARNLGSIPGRKNLIWFCGNFPSDFFPGDAGSTNGQFASLDTEYEETIDLLTASQVAIYPVDAQGLRSNAVNNAGLANPQYANKAEQLTRTGLNSANDLGNEDIATGAEHLAEERIAHDSGGQAFYNNNDLNKAVDEAVNAGSNYYTLAYSPSNPQDKVSYRHVSIKVNGQSYNLSYRRGYYAGVPAPRPDAGRTKIAGAATEPETPRALKTALLQGGPTPTEILLRVKAGPVDSGPDATAVQGNELNPDSSKSKGPYRAYQVDYATSMRAISIQKTSDNLFHANLDFIAYVYDAQGKLVNAQSNTFKGTFTANELAETLRAGLPFTQKISVPISGDHSIRVVVHDNLSDKVGAVEIPVSSIKNLPLPAPAAAAAPPAPSL